MTPSERRASVPRPIAVEDFFADPAFAHASISPDGTKIAYLAPAHGRRNVWVRGVDDDHEDAVCVTHDSRRGITTYYGSDDQRWLLYLQDTDGNEDWHLHRVDLEHPDEPAVDLTPMPAGSRVFGVDAMQMPVLVAVGVLQIEQPPRVVAPVVGGDPPAAVVCDTDGVLMIVIDTSNPHIATAVSRCQVGDLGAVGRDRGMGEGRIGEEVFHGDRTGRGCSTV